MRKRLTKGVLSAYCKSIIRSLSDYMVSYRYSFIGMCRVQSVRTIVSVSPGTNLTSGPVLHSRGPDSLDTVPENSNFAASSGGKISDFLAGAMRLQHTGYGISPK